jgi:hypothetical protein
MKMTPSTICLPVTPRAIDEIAGTKKPRPSVTIGFEVVRTVRAESGLRMEMRAVGLREVERRIKLAERRYHADRVSRGMSVGKTESALNAVLMKELTTNAERLGYRHDSPVVRG